MSSCRAGQSREEYNLTQLLQAHGDDPDGNDTAPTAPHFSEHDSVEFVEGAGPDGHRSSDYEDAWRILGLKELENVISIKYDRVLSEADMTPSQRKGTRLSHQLCN